MQNASLHYALIAILGGAAVPLLASINAAYGQQIGSVWLAALTLCVVAFLSIAAVAILSGGLTGVAAVSQGAWWHYAAGCFFAVYVVSITFVAPKIGVGNAIIFVVVAQIFTAIVIDHFGLFGAQVQPLDWKRALGVVFLIAGVALAKSQSVSAGTGG